MTASDTLVLPRVTAGPEPRNHRFDLGFRPDIQGLRAIAVVLVLVSHAGLPHVAGGFVGVDVFFVVSGFLITSLLVKEVFATGRISIAGFYARRARRILPAASAVTLATVLGSWLFFPVTRLEAVMQDALAAVASVINYRFVVEQTQYLNADQMPSPFQQYWSLAVEEQFYVVWPLLLLVLMLLVGRRPTRLVALGIAVSVLIFAATLALSVVVTAESQPTAYYAAHTRAWELAAGAFLALTLPTLKKTPKALAWLLGFAGVGAIIASGLLFTEATPFPGYAALAPVLGTMAVITSGSAQGGNPVSYLLGTGPFQFLGKVSYSLYLWHWPILTLAPLALGVEPTVRLNLILLTATVAVAQLSFMYIEEPFRNAEPLKRGHFAGLATGLACSAACVAMILTLTQVFAKVPAEDAPVNLADVQTVAELTELEEMIQDGLSVESVPADLSPSLTGADADRPATYDDGCHLDFEEVELPDGCVYGDPDSETEVFLVGDSHAAQWFPALDALASEHGWRLVNRTKSSCTPVSVHVGSTQHEGEFTECWEWKQKVFDEIDSLAPELVVFGTDDNAETGPLDVDAWVDGWGTTLERTSAAEQVAVVADSPRATGEAAPECLALNPDAVRHCVTENHYDIAMEDRREAAFAAQEAAGATVIDTEPWFCLDGKCPFIVEDMLVYRDGHHVSTPYAASLAPLLGDALPDPQ